MPSRPAPERSATVERRTELGLLLMVLLWAVNFSVVKAALEVVPPLAFNALRFPLAALTVWVLLRRRGPIAAPARRDLPKIVLLGLTGNVVYQLLFITAMDLTTAGNSALLLASTPVWVALLGALLMGERYGRRVWIGVLGTVMGMSLVVVGGPRAVALGSASITGDLLMVIAAVTWAGYTVGSKGFVSHYGSMALTAWTLWFGTPVLVLLGIPDLLAMDWGHVGPGVVAAVVYSGVFSIAVAYLFWYHGVRVLGGTRTSTFSNLVPVVALVVAWLWLGEVPGLLQLLGAAVIIAGISLARRG